MKNRKSHDIFPQYWQFDKRTNEIKQSQNAENCLDAVSQDQIQLGGCHRQKGNQEWRMNSVSFNQQIFSLLALVV